MKQSLIFLTLFFLSGLSQAAELRGEIVGITDGDTVKLLDSSRRQHKIRLTEIDTPERGQPWGKKATKALSRKISRKTVIVQTDGTDRYGRVLGRIFYQGRDINREMVSEGHAWVYRQYMTDSSFLENESQAREKRLGLWGHSEMPVAPWEWRRDSRSPIISSEPANSTGLFEQLKGWLNEGSSCGSKRYCREMKDCSEAMHYLNECGLNRLDGDSDGIPCESLCRN